MSIERSLVSVERVVFLRESDLPSTWRWQAALDQIGVDLQLDSSVEPGEHAGYCQALRSVAFGGAVSAYLLPTTLGANRPGENRSASACAARQPVQ